MSIQNKDPVIAYALSWLENAKKSVRDGFYHAIIHWVFFNFSGGRTGWENEMDILYFEPETLEQHLLRGQVHEVLLQILEVAMQHAEKKTPYAPWSVLTSTYLACAYSVARMVSQRDPSLTIDLKLRLNKISLRTGNGLRRLVEEKFTMGQEMDW